VKTSDNFTLYSLGHSAIFCKISWNLDVYLINYGFLIEIALFLMYNFRCRFNFCGRL